MKTHPRKPTEPQQNLLRHVRVRIANPGAERQRCNRLLDKHHYLGRIRPVGEQIWYVAESPDGEWVAVLVFCGAAKHLRNRDAWIGWSPAQRRRRRALVTNNARFCMLVECPNLGTRVMRLVLDRVREDWRTTYRHPVEIVESFIDPMRFEGTVYRAGNWVELGQTAGYGRSRLDYYVAHGEPKILYVRELRKRARRSLQAEHLKPELAGVEANVPVVCDFSTRQLRSLVEFLKRVPDWRGRIESYPVWSLLGIVACAHLCGAPRGQKDLAGFAKRLSTPQRRALGIRRNRARKYPTPSQPTFCRVLGQVAPLKVEEAVLMFQRQLRGPCPAEELVVLDGKELRHSQGQQLLTASTAISQYYLGSRPVSEKTNEIPVAQELVPLLDLEGRIVSLDALHTQTETARLLVQECGADYALTVKKNQPTLRATLQTILSNTPGAFSPSTHEQLAGAQPQSPRTQTADLLPGGGGAGVLSACDPGGGDPSEIGQAQTRDGLPADESGASASVPGAVAAAESRGLEH